MDNNSFSWSVVLLLYNSLQLYFCLNFDAFWFSLFKCGLTLYMDVGMVCIF